MQSFKTLGLPAPLLSSLEQVKFVTPTPIQAQAIPLALAGKDIMGSAQTGTGKTLAFVLPALTHLLKNPLSAALILVPTRELAQQVMQAVHQIQQYLPRNTGARTALLIGGAAYATQFRSLNARPRLIVGTPGRVMDHIERGSLQAAGIDLLVLDETDRMLDIGFGIQIEEIMKYLAKKRQTLMFSATFPAPMMRLAEKYLYHPERVSIGQTSTPVSLLTQDVKQLGESEKYTYLVSELAKREGSIIVFVSTKIGADQLAKQLFQQEGHQAIALHGDLKQYQREKVTNNFRKGRYRILVATDVAARGLDIPHIQHVINYDLPQVAEDYIHRIGRTARAGAKGFALCLVTPSDRRKWHAIQMLLNPRAATSAHAHAAPSSRRPMNKAGKPGHKPSHAPGGHKSEFKADRKPGSKPTAHWFSGKPSGSSSSGKPTGGDRSRGDGAAGRQRRRAKPAGARRASHA
ncbi:MAG: hypothetical protein A3J38_02845 [Gammaproteobacteria bacterium RIFCSPHIGHO2_12_FULL_45_9]|nr:MAG: hypothetical protein A3J38_02845 [Gammaproteobacteria bacterium RIFCSPHIGHO2_12_FULL_45_9]